MLTIASPPTQPVLVPPYALSATHLPSRSSRTGPNQYILPPNCPRNYCHPLATHRSAYVDAPTLAHLQPQPPEMSLVPFTTQLHPPTTTQGSQGGVNFVLVHDDHRTERQSALMKECEYHLSQYVCIQSKQTTELDRLPTSTKYFVISSLRKDLVARIKGHFKKPVIYLPRAIIEARSYYRVNLPTRHLAVSLTMHNCRVFLVQSCNEPSIRDKINEMCGTIVAKFDKDAPNVLITDRADNKYCLRAAERNISIVPKDWVDEIYSIAKEEDSSFFNHDAAKSAQRSRIKPFYGLHLKIDVKDPGNQIREMIIENQGRVIYGSESCATHVVAKTIYDSEASDNTDSMSKASQLKPLVVDVEFLRACVKLGHYISMKEYNKYRQPLYPVKQERLSPVPPPQPLVVNGDQSATPPSNEYDISSENQSMLPPPSALRQPKQIQSDNMNDMILKALSTCENAQTQLASTQMRRLPDPELRIEQTYEPSQQLYWGESVSRRN